ncbi:hypothetical protein ARMGADRAFT_1036481 [Armillaria gallica]|uniref:Uncharacterized protein n=1 Tax=Armillaria gallica TaxID=47427 RepID=A0A2H3D7X8_ARMGA|nr:hypothetical protein ARMGADRAFT_1036481 [Armillaria gallica]
MDTVIFTIISATNGMQTHQNVPDSRFLNIWDIVKAQMRRMLSNKPIPDLLECGTNTSLSMLGILCKFRDGIRHWRVVGRLSLTGEVVQGPWESRGVEHEGRAARRHRIVRFSVTVIRKTDRSRTHPNDHLYGTVYGCSVAVKSSDRRPYNVVMRLIFYLTVDSI